MQVVAMDDPLDDELLGMLGPPGFTTVGGGHGEKASTHCVPSQV
jgi:hypothetical protein